MEGLKLVFPKDAHQKSERASVRSDFKNLDSFTLVTSKNHIIRNFLRNGRVRLKNAKQLESISENLIIEITIRKIMSTEKMMKVITWIISC